MESILWIILMAGIYLLINRKKKEKRKEVKPNQPGHYDPPYSANEETRKARPFTRTSGTVSGINTVKTPAGNPAGDRYRSATAKTGGTQKPASSPDSSSVQKTAASLARAAQTDIVTRAKANAERLKEDETLKEIEQAHGHSEREEAVPMEHSRNCQALKKAEEVELAIESELGTTEDLIVKGYSGNLEFERDFLGEAMDMLSEISQV